jgi:hypothetical protein
MSAPRDRVSRNAGELLLDILEQTEPVFSSLAFSDHFPVLGQELVEAGLLRPWGGELADVVDDLADDRPVSVLAAADGGYGFFSEASGWVPTPADRLRRYKVNVATAVTFIVAPMRWPVGLRLNALASDLILELGAARILKRGAATEVWFARRLDVEGVRKAFREQTQRRPATNLRAVLTSTPADRFADLAIPGHMIVSVRDLIAHDAGLTVDPAILAARITGAPDPVAAEALYLSPDRRKLVVNEATITLNSEIHQKIVAMLVAGHRTGRRYSARELLGAAGSGAGALHRAFGKKWNDLRPHLSSHGGGWGFDL